MRGKGGTGAESMAMIGSSRWNDDDDEEEEEDGGSDTEEEGLAAASWAVTMTR